MYSEFHIFRTCCNVCHSNFLCLRFDTKMSERSLSGMANMGALSKKFPEFNTWKLFGLLDMAHEDENSSMILLESAMLRILCRTTLWILLILSNEN